MMLFNCIISAPLSAQDEVTPPQQNVTFDFSRKEPIKIVYPVIMPPYTFEDDTGVAQGLAVDLLRLWSKKTGIPVQFSSAIWNDGLQMMRDGKADIHASLYYTEKRDAYLDYAAVVASSKGGVFSHKSISNLKSIGDLKGFRVGVVRGSYHEQYIQEHLPEVPLVSYPEFPEMFAAAQKGDIRVFVGDAGVIQYQLQKRGLIDEFRYNPSLILCSNNFWIAVREGDKKLAKELEEGMALVTPEERATLERKWLTISTAKTKDTLFIAMWSDAAPFTFINAEGRPAGLFVDIWELWAEKTGKRVEFILSNWEDSLNNLKKGRADIHSGLLHSDSRAQWLDYSKPFYEASAYLFYPRDHKEPTKKDFYAGGKIGTITGSYYEEHLLNIHPKVEVVSFTSREKMLRSVLNREISACLTEYLSAQTLISRLGLSGKFNSQESMPLTWEFYWGVLKDNPQLFSSVKEGFDAITNNELLEIEQHWVLEQDKQYYRHLVKSISFTEEEQAWIAEDHTIRVTFSEAPPYFSFRGGKVHGIAVDFLNTISENTGIKFQFDKKPYRFAEELKGLKEHTGPDLVSAIMPTPEREKDILFTQLYIHSPRFIFTRDDAPFISSIENLFGKKVAVIKDYVTHRYLVDNYPDIDLMVFATNEEAIRAVSSGEAFAYIGDLLSTPAVINEFGLKNLKAACPSGLPDHDQAMGIRNDWPELRDIISKALEAIPADENAAIMNRWTTVRIEHGTRPGEVRKWILIIGGISILVVLLFIAWNRTLNRMVREKTATLAESEQRFRATFEQAAVGITHLSPEGKFLRVNQKLCDIVGYSKEELVTKTFQEITYAEDLEVDLENVRELIAREINTYTMDKRYIRKDGSLAWTNLTVSLVRDDKGQPQWFVSVIKDITERKRAEDELKRALEEVRELKDRFERENVILRTEIEVQHQHEEIIGESDVIRSVLNRAEQVAGTDTTVLITGETGTGKELLARAIHRLSTRKDLPMVTVNCAALPETLLESELFGREKGAYTGALTKQKGRFEFADGSTIFLDEISELSPGLQAKLLRVIEEGTFERLGSPTTITTDVRVLAATNRNLEEMVREGSFREDLYYRIKVFPIHLPPLRDRTADIPLMVWSFVQKFTKKMGKQIESIPRSDMESLRSYRWPGNIRELRNVIEHAMIISKGLVLRIEIPQNVDPAAGLGETLQEIEKVHIVNMLERTGWRIKGKGGAAEILGIKPATLYSRMKKLGITRPPK